MSSDTYLTIEKAVTAQLKEKGSRFLGFAFPVENEQAIEQHLKNLRKTYYDASHHCYAYMLGADKTKWRANDDGEPAHSAGEPILGQIRSRQLSDVLVVVVRYFGGTKLGVGGLIAAYKETAALTLSTAQFIQKVVTKTLRITCNYATLNEVLHIAKLLDAKVIEQVFLEKISITFQIKQSQYALLYEKITYLQLFPNFEIKVIEEKIE
jgi:uncharacterized YigZ family protein